MVTTDTQKLEFKGQSVKKTEWKQMDGQMNTTDCSFPADAVSNEKLDVSSATITRGTSSPFSMI